MTMTMTSCPMCVEKRSSVALCARCATITWFRTSGAMVATYWSVFVTVRMAQTEITEIGMSSDARTTNTHATIRLVRGAAGTRGLLGGGIWSRPKRV